MIKLTHAAVVAALLAAPGPARTQDGDAAGVGEEAAEADATEGGPRLNRLVEKLAAGEAVEGEFYNRVDFNSARATRGSDLDYVIVDMEHHPFEVETLRQMLINLRAGDGTFPVTPIVRIGTPGREVESNHWMVKQVLDAGAMGIMVPFVNTAEEARQAVIGMRYPPVADDAQPEPRGRRGWSPSVAADAWNLDVQDYAMRADLWPLDPEGEMLLAVQIETQEGIDNLAEILAVPGVGAAFIGPADLHADMGHLGETGVEEVEARMADALATAQQAGVAIGLTPAGRTIEERVEQGFTFNTR